MKLSSRARRERRKWRRRQRTHRYRLAAERFFEALGTGLIGVAPMAVSVYVSKHTSR